ncbi:uncharacterized small protein (DUF1192 family) [Roseibium hamelinense]|uniref:Uncharacterized small protein (DUF1192 family) n=1 Tax=Roseibium hamelinense TaxID=150831 RepID=A0A562SM96_9HYPH|nr:DUF1192 domain-containing protein [Roseibium hamelinense]MTI44991.1 DUF1192 domain-containing protein [Roseibium hamelinense]TWI82253.1 uncharacterized small protein (DUF1192 family) [Roseibium hamelinense]
MTISEDDKPSLPKRPQILVGEDLSKQSEEELGERIKALEAEILRTKKTLDHKRSVRTSADALFSKL